MLYFATLLLLASGALAAEGFSRPSSDPRHSYWLTTHSTGFGHWCDMDIDAALKHQLSENASIYLPSNNTFASREIRAGSPRIQPRFTAIVEPANEEDVQHIIKYANSSDIPFLAVGGSHGWQSTINNANGGLQINMRKLDSISLSDDGTIAKLGGGVRQKLLTETLFKLGKQAVSGLCECTSIIGPLMGGGHSALQGFYGFSSDNLVSAHVVLGDGTAVTASATENSDLFWGLRGAGHNFGIVTSFEVRAYDLPATKWIIVTVIYTQDKLEDFIDALNEVDNGGDHTPELVLAGAITRIPDIATDHPVVAHQLSYLGSRAEVEPYVQRFQQAGPVAVQYAENVEYVDYYTATNNGLDQNTCRTNLNIFGYAISLPRYNKTAIRKAFGYFSELTADERYNSSAWLLESYGSRGVRAQDYSASAVPAAERDLPCLTVPITWWAGDSVEAREKANKYGALMRATLATGESEGEGDVHVYLNYATGSESLEQMYGDDERLRKLKALKGKWDPLNRFRFYMPLA